MSFENLFDIATIGFVSGFIGGCIIYGSCYAIKKIVNLFIAITK